MLSKLKEKYNQLMISDKKLYLVTNSDSFSSEDDFLDAIASALEGGVDMVQLREKNLSASKILSLGKKIKQLCLQYDATFIVNDRIDIAAILEADGVHLGQDDLDVKSAREILGENAIVGISTHSPEQAQKAVADGADYISVGPVFMPSPNQMNCLAGLEYVNWVSKNIKIPAFAIGGIDLDNVGDIVKSGLKRVAVVRAILNTSSPKLSAETFCEKLN